LIIATSNNSEFNRFLAEKEEAPIVDRCRICYVSHNTNYKMQSELTGYAIGTEARTTLTRESLHQDPNLNYAASVAAVLSRLPRSEKLTPIETMKLAAGEVAGEKSIKTLAEVIDTSIRNRTSPSASAKKDWGSATWAGPFSCLRKLGNQ
jgi:serine protein kinase